METILMLIANPVVIRLALSVIEYFAERKNISKEERRVFVRLAEILRKQGLENVRSRFEAEDQIKEGNKMWDERGKKK